MPENVGPQPEVTKDDDRRRVVQLRPDQMTTGGMQNAIRRSRQASLAGEAVRHQEAQAAAQSPSEEDGYIEGGINEVPL